MQKFDINSQATPGTVLEVDGQKFYLVSIEPYTRKDGGKSAVATWEVGCARCGDRYEVTTGLSGGIPIRRCEPCRRIARGRIGKRGKGLTVRIVPA